MPRQRIHTHPCRDCETPVECPGEWEQNVDGIPEVICREYHEEGGGTNYDFVCDACEAKREAEWRAEVG